MSFTVRGKIEVHNTADLISIISQEISIDVTTAFMESTKIKEMVMPRISDIDTISGLAFLNSSGHIAESLASCNAKDRIEDLAFIKLSCCLDVPWSGVSPSQVLIYSSFLNYLNHLTTPILGKLYPLSLLLLPSEICSTFLSHQKADFQRNWRGK